MPQDISAGKPLRHSPWRNLPREPPNEPFDRRRSSVDTVSVEKPLTVSYFTLSKVCTMGLMANIGLTVRQHLWQAFDGLLLRGVRSVALVLSLIVAQASASFGDDKCVAIVPTANPPKYASDYPVPLSLRRNLVFIVQRGLTKDGAYSGPIDGVYHIQLKQAVRDLQTQLGEDATGCLTWTVVNHYAPKE